MLGEKRSQSLFAPKASAEKAAATHITTGPDGRKKELPLYFGPDCPVSGNMGQNQHEAGVGEPQPADEPLRHAPADDGTGVEADPTDSVNMAEDLPRRSLNTESAGGYRAHSLFFTPENEGQDFNTVLQDVQEYISGKYSALITEGGDEDAKAQIKRYITKYVQDRRIAVKGYSGDQLVDALYTEMAEFGLLTKYIFGTGIEEINVNSWRDIEVLYANGETVKLEEHFDSPEHAVNVIRRMLHVSGMVLDNASPAVLGHLSKNIRIAVLKTPLVDEDVGVTASIRIVNPQNMQKKDFVKGGTATGPMLDFLAACLRYGVSVCVAGATGSGKTTVAGWLLTTIPDNKRIFTIENGSRELDLVREKDGRVCNSVIHTITRESENAKQNIDQDTKGDLFRNYAGIAKDCYGYQIAVLDLRNPTRSDGNNLLHLINKYMDIYKADPKNLAAKAKAEKYSKILAKTLINTSGGDSAQYGQNAFFYDSAEGLLTAMFLLVAEYLPTEDADGNPIEKRHIVSVFKLVQELLAPSRVKGKNQFQLLLEKLPPNHKARWFAGSALNTAEQAMASVISTVLSRLNAFLDSEMEQILCFDTAIDAEKFCNEKSAIFIVLPEEDQTKYFMVSLILQNLYREILTVADENGGRLKNRVVFFADELGTCPPIQSLELMFSASRSRGLMLVPIVQSITGQLQKNYGKEGSEIIVDNCQVNLYGGFAPASQTAVELSKSLGSRTVMSGSISRGKNDPSQSLQMMERPLMTPDELKSMPKGSFIVAKTGVHPMKVKLRLFLDWGIRFGMPYEVPEKAQRFVAYADKQELEESIIRRHYGTIVMDSEQPQGGGTSAGGMAQGIQAAPDSRKTVFRP
ncbi:MAG: ATPase, T2SS/T4P/T4SS family [Oscillospiraceae bacterium]